MPEIHVEIVRISRAESQQEVHEHQRGVAACFLQGCTTTREYMRTSLHENSFRITGPW